MSTAPGDNPGNSPDERAPHPMAGLRHDLSSPLTVIRGHGQLLRLRVDGLDVPAAEQARLGGHLDAIEEALDRIEAMLFPETIDARRGSLGRNGAAGDR